MDQRITTLYFRRYFSMAVRLSVILFILPLVSFASADTDVQTNNKEGREMTPLMPELSCSKQARRIEKLDNKKKRRKFIESCRAERQVRMKAPKELEKQEKEKKKQEENAYFESFKKVPDLDPKAPKPKSKP